MSDVRLYFVFAVERIYLYLLDISMGVSSVSIEASTNVLIDTVGVRYCFTCQCIKPDRAHHCSVCGKCVLKYDHHCPWYEVLSAFIWTIRHHSSLFRTNSCISYANYKFFVLFLGWALMFCGYVAATSLEYFILFWQVNRKSIRSLSSDCLPLNYLILLFFFKWIQGVTNIQKVCLIKLKPKKWAMPILF